MSFRIADDLRLVPPNTLQPAIVPIDIGTSKLRAWWTEDGQGFCVLVNDGVNQATVSLTQEEGKAFLEMATS